MSDIAQWFKNLPIFTRYWLGLTAAFSLLGRFGLLSAKYLILQYEPFLKGFQCIFDGRPADYFFMLLFNWVCCVIVALLGDIMVSCLRLLLKFNLSMTLVEKFKNLNHRNTAVFQRFSFILISRGVEEFKNKFVNIKLIKHNSLCIFDGRPADYFFMLLFNWVCCVIVALLGDIMLLMDPMVLSVLYVWCQLNKDMIVNFWFGTQFKAMYLPWVLLAFNLVISGGGMMELVGIMVGHLYFFLMFKYPQELGGPVLLTTPSILYKYFPNQRGGIHGFGQPPTARRPANDGAGGGGGGGGRHNWGQGNILGGQ
uniref:Derlin n=1 Tax=Timema cristinae TaxID=61476 RepID=A0A7R9CFJ1_TIMCR|nr:unnamed protein product [Timema cristinae]